MKWWHSTHDLIPLREELSENFRQEAIKRKRQAIGGAVGALAIVSLSAFYELERGRFDEVGELGIGFSAMNLLLAGYNYRKGREAQQKSDKEFQAAIDLFTAPDEQFDQFD